MGDMEVTKQKKRYGPYLIYEDATVIDVRTGKKLKKHLRHGKYVVGLRMEPDSVCVYHQLIRLLYILFVNPEITRYDYIIPIDGDYTNLSLDNWKMISAAEYHKNRKSVGRKKIVDQNMEDKIMKLHAAGNSLREIGRECNISCCTVHRVVNGTYRNKGRHLSEEEV